MKSFKESLKRQLTCFCSSVSEARLCSSSVSASPIFKHYRVTRMPDGSFSIDVENPVSENSKYAFRAFYNQVLSQVFSHLLIKSLTLDPQQEVEEKRSA